MNKSVKKILFILHYPPPVHGAAMVGQYIRESKHINSTFDCQYINLGTSVRIDEIGKGGLIKAIRYFKLLGLAIGKLYGFKPNLVYLTLTASGAGFYKDALIAVISKVFGKKVVVHFHNKGVSKRQDKWFDNLLYKMVFKNTEVILLSKNLYSDLVKYVLQEQVHYCANGIPENRGHVLTLKNRRKNGKIQILFLSNLIESKGVFVLLEACQILQTKQLSFHCTFIGGAGDVTGEQFQKKVNALGLSNNVHYAGRKYGLEKEEMYAQADIFAFPSYNETFGLVNLEAMQYSLPIVSTFEGGIPDVVEDGKTGFLVQQRDAKALAEKLEILIKDADLRLQLGQNGRKRYEKLFRLDVFEKRFAHIIKELA